jgi:hypothetical protein
MTAEAFPDDFFSLGTAGLIREGSWRLKSRLEAAGVHRTPLHGHTDSLHWLKSWSDPSPRRRTSRRRQPPPGVVSTAGFPSG